MQVLKNNNWIILDSLGNIYEIHTNLTVMTTILNLNHFWIIQAKLCLKDTFVTTSFIFVTIVLYIYVDSRRKIFLNPSCTKCPKVIEINNIINLYFHTSLCASKRFYERRKVFITPFWGTKKKSKNKKLCHPPSLIRNWDNNG